MIRTTTLELAAHETGVKCPHYLTMDGMCLLELDVDCPLLAAASVMVHAMVLVPSS